MEQDILITVANRFETSFFLTHSDIIFVWNLFRKIYVVMFVTLWNIAIFPSSPPIMKCSASDTSQVLKVVLLDPCTDRIAGWNPAKFSDA